MVSFERYKENIEHSLRLKLGVGKADQKFQFMAKKEMKGPNVKPWGNGMGPIVILTSQNIFQAVAKVSKPSLITICI